MRSRAHPAPPSSSPNCSLAPPSRRNPGQGSVLAGRSFAVEFFMDWYPQQFWCTPLVRRLTSRLAWVWIASQAVMTGAALVGRSQGLARACRGRGRSQACGRGRRHIVRLRAPRTPGDQPPPSRLPPALRLRLNRRMNRPVPPTTACRSRPPPCNHAPPARPRLSSLWAPQMNLYT
jgi:hypothetical protein